MLLVRYLSTANVRVAIFHISPISWVIAVSSHVTTDNALGQCDEICALGQPTLDNG